jgi:branched-chain amino acid transport system substrate-binding protein
MSEKDERSVSRREFLKIAGVAGAAVGLGAGLGGLAAACGGTTTTTAGATTTAAEATTTTVAASTTTVSAGPETGREVKLGFVAPITGALAAFGIPDQYCVDRAREAIGDGIVCGDGQKHPVTITLSDSQSDAGRAAQVAGDLINNTKVDILLACSTADTVIGPADQAEANGVPCLCSDCPWQSFVGGRTDGDLSKTFKWTYNVFWGAEDLSADFITMFNELPTNKVIGFANANDADGIATRPPLIAAYQGAGFTVVDQSGFPHGQEDYTAIIDAFKKAGAEIGVGVLTPPDFTTLWKQSIQQGWTPKIGCYSKPILFPTVLEAIGSIGDGLSTEVWWSPAYPFTSPLVNQTCQEFADDFEAKQNLQWTQPLMHFLVFEWAVDVLKRATSVDDPEALVSAVKATKMESIAGPIDFTAAVEPPGPPWNPGPRHVHENVYKSPVAGGQWRKSTKHPFELVIVSNTAAPMVTVQDKLLAYAAG